MNLLYKLLRLFLDKPIPPETIKHIKSRDVRKLLGNITKDLIILDSNYNVSDKCAVETFLKSDLVSTRNYERDKHDCDNFAFSLFVNAKKWAPLIPLGIVIGHSSDGGYHAWNMCVTINTGGELEIWMLEPQTDKLFRMTTEEIDYIII